MKKIFSLILICFMLLSSAVFVSADELSWETALKKVIVNSPVSDFLLMDVSGDGIPELFCPGGNGVASYYFEQNNVVQASSDAYIPYEFVARLIGFRSGKSNTLHYMGQALHAGDIVTYKMSFFNCAPVLEILAKENPGTGSGEFKGKNTSLDKQDDIEEKVIEYLKDYTGEYFVKATMTGADVRRYGKKGAADRLFLRYSLFSQLSDDSSIFTTSQRDKIKKSVGGGKFLGFDRISVLDDDAIFVEYFVDESPNSDYLFNYNKQFSLVSGNFDVIKTAKSEAELDVEHIVPYLSPRAMPSNIVPDYEKAASFRGIDDYVTYFSSLLIPDSEINENGRKEIAKFIEYAVNKCSRAEIDAKDNVLSIKASKVSIISQNATKSMGQFESLCKSRGIGQLRTAKTVPELVCKNIDFTKPIRCEVESGTAKALSSASGLRIMLNDTLGIYINSAELAILENEFDTFAIEFTQNTNDYSIVFTDKTNNIISDITVPVWFIVPASGDYSSVLASYDGGTESRGGQFDSLHNTIEFSATHSGNYQVINEDITINDIDSVSFSANQAIRFLVTKGVLSVDRSKNFYPNQNMSRYDFTKALVSMFYATDNNAECTFSDVDKKNSYYPFVATAQLMDMAKPIEENKFGGNEPVTNEYMLMICGKILAEKKGYKFPENYVDYLNLTDKTEITATAMPYIAVAIQCGLAQNNGALKPQDAVTKEKCAQILYKTFTLLYDTSPVTTSFSAVLEVDDQNPKINDLTPLERGIACVLVTALFAFAFWLLTKKRKPYNG